MKVFVDTSAFYASLNPEDHYHHAAQQTLEHLKESEPITTNYVLLECASLIQKRQGFSPAKIFLTKISEMLQIVWIDERLHQEAISIWTKAQNRGLSLVDCTSFAAMKHAGVRQVIAFDPHFVTHGFEILP